MTKLTSRQYVPHVCKPELADRFLINQILGTVMSCMNSSGKVRCKDKLSLKDLIDIKAEES